MIQSLDLADDPNTFRLFLRWIYFVDGFKPEGLSSEELDSLFGLIDKFDAARMQLELSWCLECRVKRSKEPFKSPDLAYLLVGAKYGLEPVFQVVKEKIVDLPEDSFDNLVTQIGRQNPTMGMDLLSQRRQNARNLMRNAMKASRNLFSCSRKWHQVNSVCQFCQATLSEDSVNQIFQKVLF
jgi:hypothetical protein